MIQPIAICLAFIAGSLLGCEQADWDTGTVAVPPSDPELYALAVEQNADLAAAFNVEPVDMSLVSVNWGAESMAYRSIDTVTISEIERGGDFVEEHVRHEMTHIVLDVTHDAQEFSGIAINSVVRSWY